MHPATQLPRVLPPHAPLLTRGAVCLLFRPLQLVPIDCLLSFHFIFNNHPLKNAKDSAWSFPASSCLTGACPFVPSRLWGWGANSTGGHA